MAKRQARQIDYQSLESRDLVWLVQVDNDRQAYELLTERKDEVIRRLVRNCIRKYTFVDGDDMYQSLALNFPKIVRTYRPGKANTDWDKYCYHRLTYMIKDILRQRDDLGICWPQKKQYPDWFHLYDKSDASDGCHADLVGDHRHLTEDAREWLEFYESIEQLRSALQHSREQLAIGTTRGKPASHEKHPAAWTTSEPDDTTGRSIVKYYWSPVQTGNTRKRNQSSVDRPPVGQWRLARNKPKQIVMVFK